MLRCLLLEEHVVHGHLVRVRVGARARFGVRGRVRFRIRMRVGVKAGIRVRVRLRVWVRRCARAPCRVARV